jgi:hypothetical protein
MERRPGERSFEMGQSLDQILSQIANGDSVNVTIVSNQDNGIASYAVGSLIFQEGNVLHNVPASLYTQSPPFQMYFSDRIGDLEPPPPPASFGLPGQPFDAYETENLGVSILRYATGHVEMQLAVFGTKSSVTLSPMGDLLVGLGPSLGHSAAGVFVVAFTGINTLSC